MSPDAIVLARAVAAVWLLTAVEVLHPAYRAVGEAYLDRLGLPHALMWLACAGELLLGLAVAILPPTPRLSIVQAVLVAGFTVTLAALEPMLLVHPFGVLSKNYPLLCAIGAALLLEREGWTRRAEWVLRGGMALVWITEGLFPKLLFQQPMEFAVVAQSGLIGNIAPSLFLAALGVAQLLSGIAALVLRGRWLRAVLAAQLVALLVLPLLVSRHDPLLWVHPFGPLIKNIPLVVGTALLLRR